MPFLDDAAIEDIAALDAADEFHICHTGEPANLAAVTSTTLGVKTAPGLSAVENSPTDGRQRRILAFTDGDVTTTHATGPVAWALIEAGVKIWATGTISNPQAVDDANPFEMSDIPIRKRDATAI